MSGSAAALPPPGLPGLNPAWSRLVSVRDRTGASHTWHILDSATDSPSVGTLLCVHGNPTWSYLWRHLVAAPPPGWRVVAVDQLGMGYSERLSQPRTLSERIDDLQDLTDALELTGPGAAITAPVITVAHDWGGVISLGWALRHRDQLAGIILTNTAVHQPGGATAPALIRIARAPGIRQLVCQWTPIFVRATTALSRPALPRSTRNAFAAPYRAAARRASVADFVADIPLDSGHRSAAALAAVVDALPALGHTPALLLWGPRDPVFSDLYLRDLIARLPNADVHRFEGASHLVTEDRPETASVMADWIGGLSSVATAGPSQIAAAEVALPAASLFAQLAARKTDPGVAVVQMSQPRRQVSFAELDSLILSAAAILSGLGVRQGSRVALLVPPGIELTVAVYACWRIGAVVVVADAGLGLKGMGRALRGSGGDFVIAARKGLLAARLMRLPGRAISIDTLMASKVSAPDERRDEPDRDGEAAVLFTSGATGPSKGVLYRHRQLQAQVQLLRATYDLTADDRLVAAFAPFSLYAPALGIASVVPDMDVTAPATLSAAALADAIAAIEATVVFAAPAALRNVVATSAGLTARQRKALAGPRLVLSAGAPVAISLQQAIGRLLPNASIHTPYGMTEALPVTDSDLTELEKLTGTDAGVCVGRPVSGVSVRVSRLGDTALAVADPEDIVGVVGEICVSAGHIKDRYDRLWATEAASARNRGWHRTGDVGQVDVEGRVWVQGRLRDVITTPDGPLTPVPVEQRIEGLAQVHAAAVVGVGPNGTQQAVAMIVRASAGGAGFAGRGPRLADLELSEQVREVAGCPIAAVLVVDALPVDIRHNSKVDRRALAIAASRTLSGKSASLPDRLRRVGPMIRQSWRFRR